MFLTETHMHTAETSGCASATGAQQADQYKSLGYDTIIITDHFFNGNNAVDRSQPWEKQIDDFCLGYENAKKRGKEIGLNVLFGFEYTWDGADFLTYGVGKDWLKENSDVMDISVYEFCDRVHKAGGAIVHAHPFRQEFYIKDFKFLPYQTDGVEVFNGHNRVPEWNDRALWYADQFGFVHTAGSDCHHIGCRCFCGVETEFEIRTIEDYIRAVKENKIAGIRKVKDNGFD